MLCNNLPVLLAGGCAITQFFRQPGAAKCVIKADAPGLQLLFQLLQLLPRVANLLVPLLPFRANLPKPGLIQLLAQTL